jgi:hypothetical protein
VTGLVLAVFLGTMVGLLVPAVNSLEATPQAGLLSNILMDQVGLSPAAGQELVSGIRAIPGAAVYPLYLPGALPGPGATKKIGPAGPPGGGSDGTGPGGPQVTDGGPGQGDFGDNVAVSCADLRAIAALGQCAPGVAVVQVSDGSLGSDNPIFFTKPIADANSQPYTGDLTTLPLQTVLVKVDSASTLERVRTYLAVNAPPQVGGGYGASPTPPRTFGESLQIRLARAATFEKMLYAAVALTLIVAGCSLAVSIGGGLVDRKRPFTLLRVSGTQVGVLSRVALLEAAIPLVAATLVAAGIAYGTSVMVVLRLAPAGTPIPQLGGDYYTIMGVGLLIAFGVITVTLPLLRRMTAPSTVRFE